MKNYSTPFLIVMTIAIPLLTTGCNSGGGGGLFGLFGGGSETSEVLSLFSSNGEGSSGTGENSEPPSESSGGNDVGGSTGSLTIATVHSPEPASVAFFGIGLAGLAHSRRRKTRGSTGL